MWDFICVFFVVVFFCVLGCGRGLKMIVEGMPSFSQSFALSSHKVNQNLIFFIFVNKFSGPMWTHMGPHGPAWAHMGPHGPMGPMGPKSQSLFFDRRLQRNGGSGINPRQSAETVSSTTVQDPPQHAPRSG